MGLYICEVNHVINKSKLPYEWNEIELGDIFNFEKKSGIKAGENIGKGKYKFFTSSDIQSKFINKAIFDGEYLIFSTGGNAGIHYINEKFSTSTDCFVVKVDNRLLSKYVYYYLFTNIHILEEGFKGAGLKHISKEYIKRIKIIFPEKKETQQKIVSILEKTERIKEMRKETDGLTKDFLKAIFMEMFKKYFEDKKYLKKIEFFCLDKKNSIKAGPFGSSLKKDSYVKKGYKIYGQEQVIKDDLKFGDYYINKEKYLELENYNVQEGDILISLVGTYGKISIVPKDFEEGVINPRLMKITLDKTKMNPIFFKYLFLSHYVRSQLEKVSHGGTMDILNVGLIKNTNFPETPIFLQQKFASIVNRVNAMKEQQKHSKEQIDNLFNALMQKAFKGELV